MLYAYAFLMYAMLKKWKHVSMKKEKLYTIKKNCTKKMFLKKYVEIRDNAIIYKYKSL